MAGPGEHDQDFDDWFDEPEPPPQRRRRGWRAAGDPVGEDAWTIADAPASRAARTGPREPIVIGGRVVTPTQLAVVAASALALLLAILAAAGVFSSGSKPAVRKLTVPATVATPPTPAPTTGLTPTVQAPTAALKPGDTGAQVTMLQQALTALGYSPGKADGSYGPATQTAVKDFQTASGLTADGVVGPQTLAALQKALATKGG